MIWNDFENHNLRIHDQVIFFFITVCLVCFAIEETWFIFVSMRNIDQLRKIVNATKNEHWQQKYYDSSRTCFAWWQYHFHCRIESFKTSRSTSSRCFESYRSTNKKTDFLFQNVFEHSKVSISFWHSISEKILFAI